MSSSTKSILVAGGTYADVIRQAARIFASAGIEDAGREARMLLASASELDAAGLVLRETAQIDQDTLDRFSGFVERRAKREPVSRILGVRSFWEDEFIIGPGVLDPRPDTETIISAATHFFSARGEGPKNILDLGTGSGAILCSLLREFPSALGLGLDVSLEACEIARKNLHRLDLKARASIRQTDWAHLHEAPWDLIVSNPPYIEQSAIEKLDPEVRQWDPALALDGGTDGLDAYRSLAPLFASHLAPGGLGLVEIGYDQAASVPVIFAANALNVTAIHRDFGGNARVVEIRHI